MVELRGGKYNFSYFLSYNNINLFKLINILIEDEFKVAKKDEFVMLMAPKIID